MSFFDFFYFFILFYIKCVYLHRYYKSKNDTDMRKSVLLFICLFLSLGFVSCQDDNDNDILGNFPPPSLEGLLLDGGQIFDISLYCIKNRYCPIGENWYDYCKSVKTMPDY